MTATHDEVETETGAATAVRPEAWHPGGRRPVFAGLKVADFSWAAAAPIVTRFLSDYGATVVRVESRAHMDSVRFGGPFLDGVPDVNTSGFFAEFNAGKLGITLDMGNETARDVARRLIGWADVVTERFSPGVMDRWGLGWEDVHALNPSAVMVSSSMRGAHGPQSDYRGYGGQGAALAGMHLLTGWPDRNPAGPKGAYTDSIAPRYGLAALTAALIRRRRDGVGQYIEMSQVECALQFVTTELLDHQLTGAVAGPMGNASAHHAPHGMYPCLGDDRWIALAVESDEEWRRLRVAMGEPGWAADPDLATATGRLRRRDEVDRELSGWTATWEPYPLLTHLQRAGVRSGVAQKPSDLFDDPQLAHRGHFVDLDGGALGRVGYNASSFRLSATPGLPWRGTPDLGEHTTTVLTELLGYSAAEVEELARAGALH